MRDISYTCRKWKKNQTKIYSLFLFFVSIITTIYIQFRPMNSINNHSLLSITNCSLQDRVYTSSYLFFKLLNATYLRLLIGPGILLNTLCLIVLSRPRLSTKSTTIVFLRFLALFDILAITLKYIRAEINYQSIEKGHEILILTEAVCKTLYVLMNSSISIAMWIIVLMSLDKAIAVTYPLKSSIWLTHKRVFYICCCTIIILLLANLSFINLSGIRISRNRRKYCGLDENSIIVDLLTASILPMGLITAANIVIALVLRRVSRNSLDLGSLDDGDKRDSDPNIINKHTSTPLNRLSASSIPVLDLISATKRRTSIQVTRMLLAVTLSLIICNIPNTILFVVFKIYDTRQLLIGRLCINVSDSEIKLYKFGFYSSVMQDILSDLPHIFNFFLYCLAGKKFRSIFINEVQHFLFDLHLIHRRGRRFTQGTFSGNHESISRAHIPSRQGRLSTNTSLPKTRKTVEVLFNGTTTKTLINPQNKKLLKKTNPRHTADESNIYLYTTIQ